jgi:uncharacterized SAM-binding protein YcdF (DUF218 family)
VYNFASKVLSSIVDPAALACALTIAALVLWRFRRAAFVLTAAAALVIASLSLPNVSAALLRTLEDQYPDVAVQAVAPAQAIVLLGGGLNVPAGSHPASALADAGDRVLVAFRLYRAGKAPLVVCSGGNNPLFGAGGAESEGRHMCEVLQEWGMPAAAIAIEGESINTRENAVASRALLARRGIARILLVTSASHMPRAAAVFRKVGFDVVAAPADFRTGRGTPHPILRWVPSAHALADSATVLHEWLGLWIYRSRGWA